MKYPIHPIADMFPMLEGKELQEMADDIKQNGLMESIKVWNNQIIDGRNRLKACEMAGVQPAYTEIDGDDPVACAKSLNIVRRQMTKMQIGIVIAKLTEPMTKAKSIKKAREAKASEGQNCPSVKTDAGRAEEAGISARTLKTARKLNKDNPELADEVLSGKKPPKAKSGDTYGQKVAMAYDAFKSGVYTNQQEAAHEHDVSATQIQYFQVVLSQDPGAALSVRNGSISLTAAHKAVKEKEREAELPTQEIFAKLSQKHQKILERHMDDGFKKMRADCDADLMQQRTENIKRKTELDKQRASISALKKDLFMPFTEKEYKLVLGMLHPDKHPENKDRAQKAFGLMQKFKHYFEFKKVA